MDKREQFEAWAKGKFDLTIHARDAATGRYFYNETWYAWCAWQAAQAAPSEAVTIEQLRGLLEAVRVFRNEPMLGALTKLRGTQSYHDMTVAWKDADDFIRDLAAPAQPEPVAFVPIHPKNGPLWANTVQSLDVGDRPHHYAVMPLYTHPAPGWNAAIEAAAPPEPVAHPSQQWCDDYAYWHERYIRALAKEQS